MQDFEETVLRGELRVVPEPRQQRAMIFRRVVRKGPDGKPVMRNGKPVRDWDDGESVPLTEALLIEQQDAEAAAGGKSRDAQEKTPTSTEFQASLSAVLDRVRSGRSAEQIKGDFYRGVEQEQQASLAFEEGAKARAAGIPKDLIKGLQRTPESRPALVEARAWAKTDKRALLLCGNTGAGKSYAAARWLASMPSGSWCWCGDLDLAVRPDEHGEGARLLRRWLGSSALVIDELSTRWGPAAISQIATMICKVIDDDGRLVITTNLTESQVWQLFQDRIKRRFDDHGTVITVGPWRAR